MPSHILQSFDKHHLNLLKSTQGVTQSTTLLSQSNYGFGSCKEVEVFKGSIKSHRPIHIVKHLHAKFQGSQGQVAQSKALIASQSTVGAKWSFGSQKSKKFGQHLILKPQSSFGQVLTMIPQEWLKNHQDAKVSIFGQLKSQL